MQSFHPGGNLPDGDGFALGIDGNSLHAGVNLHTGKSGELLRRVDDQLIPALDGPADVIGQTAAGIGDVGSLGQQHHLVLPVFPLQLGGSFGSGGHTA